jgi:epsilon-lactone hydrolase
MRLSKDVLRTVDRLTLRRTFGMGYRSGRILVDAISYLDPVPRGVKVRKGIAAGRPSLLVVPDGADERPSVVWMHGGAFCFNSPRAYATTVAYIAKAIGASILVPSYRRAPEHPYPAAHEDTLAVFRSVSDGSRPVIVGGDSAGGNLALAAAIALRDAGEPAPAGMLLMSPWVDLTLSGESIHANDGKDAILRAKDLPRHTKAYAGDIDPADPRVSPLNADLAGLPPALIQCGSDELFLTECNELAARLERAGSHVELQVYADMWHDFQAHAGMLEEAATAVERMGEWARPLLA